LQEDSLLLSHQGSPKVMYTLFCFFFFFNGLVMLGLPVQLRKNSKTKQQK